MVSNRKHFVVSYKKGGRPPKYSKCEILNAIFMYCAQDVNGAIYSSFYNNPRRFHPRSDYYKKGYTTRFSAVEGCT